MKTLVKTLAITLACLVFLLSLPFIALEVVCIPKVTNKILAYVPDYMQAEAEVGELDYKLSSWPNVGVKLHDLVIYTHIPEVRYTLLAVDTLDVAVDVMAFLNENKVNIVLEDESNLEEVIINNENIYLKESDNVNLIIIIVSICLTLLVCCFYLGYFLKNRLKRKNINRI